MVIRINPKFNFFQVFAFSASEYAEEAANAQFLRELLTANLRAMESTNSNRPVICSLLPRLVDSFRKKGFYKSAQNLNLLDVKPSCKVSISFRFEIIFDFEIYIFISETILKYVTLQTKKGKRQH